MTVSAATSEAGSRPNFVILLADDLGYGDLGCYGHPQVRTPHLDGLAASGLRFGDFHSSGAVCSPTRAGLLTGRYQQRAGIPGVILADPKAGLRHHGLQPGEATLAGLLRSAGYATGICGKWHLGYEPRYNPVRHGFDVFRGYVSGNVDYFSHLDGAGIPDWWDGDRLAPEDGYTTHLITRHAVRFIEAHAQEPFCLYVAHEAVHSPYQGPGDGPVRTADGQKLPERRDRVSAYREMTEAMDAGVGEVLAALARHGLEERTLVFFFSDNGATRIGSNGVLRGGKGTLWEGGHRIPAIARWPGRIAAGSRCDVPTICLDLLPTLLGLAGASTPPRPLDGIDLRRLLFGTGVPTSRRIFWGHGRDRAVRDGAWKLLLRDGAPPALFDLESDLTESNDLAAREPARVARLREAVAAWERDVTRDAMPQPMN